MVCLFAGHTHKSEIWHMEEEYGSKKTIFTGQYSELNKKVMLDSMWGFRELILTDTYAESNYITPENRLVIDGVEVHHPYGKQDGIRIELK